MYSYLLWLGIFVVLPLILLTLRNKTALRRYRTIMGLMIIGALVFSIPWDRIAIKEGIWYFTEPHIIGVWLAGVPIEEWLFIILVTTLFTTITILAWERFGNKAYVR